jgi:hypothetical protein
MNGFSSDEIRSRHSEEIEELHKQLDDKDRILSTYRAEHGKLEVFFKRVIDSIKPIMPFDSVYERMQKPSSVSSEIGAVFHVTDSHMGAVQESDEIEQFNEFNPDICDARNIAFVRRGIDWVNLHRTSYHVKNIHLILTGDLISGDIHDELRVTNAFPVPEQVVRAAQIHAKQIALLAPHCEQLNVHFISEDNHSRLTKKPQAKEAGKNSYNYLVGKMIEIYVQNIKNVNFNLYAMHEKVIQVENRNYLIKHGHGIKAWMGIPFYGIERSIARESTARQNIIMDDIQRAKDIGFHKIVMGHFHTPMDHWLYSIGGSVQGTDAYDHSAGRYSPPTQSAWLVHPKYGEFNRINFNLKHI